jgi:UDP-N-acetylmuramyl pentapeptide phosphotransferase/UDP-N-acetylglucosamine-1-phosphate transferase
MSGHALALGSVTAGIALAVAIGIALLRKTEWSARLADRPNERSLHSVPKPRIGGLVMVPVILASVGWLVPERASSLLLPCALVLAVSLADDLNRRPIAVRLAFQVVAALLAVGSPTPAGLLAALAIVWSCNLYNFMDGADGLAGGMTAIGFAALAWVAASAGHDGLATTCLVVASASLGFLAWNFPPARVFMGDAGSVPLGFLAGAVSWQGSAEGAWSLAVPLLAFAPFWIDASATLLRRVAGGEKFWTAHRSHCYQRLVLAGWSHRRLALSAYLLMLACALAAIAISVASETVQGAIIIACALAFAAVGFFVDRRCRVPHEASR